MTLDLPCTSLASRREEEKEYTLDITNKYIACITKAKEKDGNFDYEIILRMKRRDGKLEK